MYRCNYPELARLRKTAWPWSFYDTLHLECWVYRSLCGKQTMTDQDGIQLNVTQNGKMQLIAQRNGESVQFILNHESAKNLRNQFQSVLSQIDPKQDNPHPHKDD